MADSIIVESIIGNSVADSDDDDIFDAISFQQFFDKIQRSNKISMIGAMNEKKIAES